MKIALIILGIVVVTLAAGLVFVTVKDRDIRSMVISEVDLAKVPDGVYTGTYQSWRFVNEVEVTVKDHRIIAIKSLNKLPDARSQSIADQAAEAILVGQSVQIDVISGASLNTRSFQKAVENALREGVDR